MIIKFTEQFTIKILRRIAKINNIKYISDLNKKNLLSYLNVHKSATVIQKYFRLQNITDECPISMEKLKYPFIVIKSNNKFNYYDFDTIIKYFSTSRDFRDPLTREKIQDNTIERINRFIIYYYGPKSNKLLWSDSMIKKLQFECILNNLSNIMNEIMSIDELTLDFIVEVINPQFVYNFQYLANNYENVVSDALKISIDEINTHKCKNKKLILNSLFKLIEVNNL